MAKHRKRMKLPNNFGSIKYLGKGRRRPYGVYPPVTEYSLHGPITPKALAYAETWEEGYEILTTYHMEKAGKITVNRGMFIDRTPTFSEVYEGFFREKFYDSPKKLSKASMASTRAAFNNCASIHNIQFGQLKYDDLQDILNNCQLKHASLELIVSLLHQMYKYALKYEIADKDYSAFLYLPKEDDDSAGIPSAMISLTPDMDTEAWKNFALKLRRYRFPDFLFVANLLLTVSDFGILLPAAARFRDNLKFRII